VHVMHSSRCVSQYSWCLHVIEAKLSGIKVANNTSSNDAATKFDLRRVEGRFLVLLRLWLEWLGRFFSAESPFVFCKQNKIESVNISFDIVLTRDHYRVICGRHAPLKPQKSHNRKSNKFSSLSCSLDQ
jgi:hypothetical protein